jgi:hypothetical protein
VGRPCIHGITTSPRRPNDLRGDACLGLVSPAKQSKSDACSLDRWESPAWRANTGGEGKRGSRAVLCKVTHGHRSCGPIGQEPYGCSRDTTAVRSCTDWFSVHIWSGPGSNPFPMSPISEILWWGRDTGACRQPRCRRRCGRGRGGCMWSRGASARLIAGKMVVGRRARLGFPAPVGPTMQMMLIMVACLFPGSHLAGVFGRHHPDRLLALGPLQGVSEARALAAPLVFASSMKGQLREGCESSMRSPTTDGARMPTRRSSIRHSPRADPEVC